MPLGSESHIASLRQTLGAIGDSPMPSGIIQKQNSVFPLLGTGVSSHGVLGAKPIQYI